MYPFFYLFTKSPLEGAQTSLNCALMPFKNISIGSYYADCKVKKEVLPENWKTEAEGLYEWSEKSVQKFK